MDLVFLKVLEMSFMGSIVILITMLARFILKKRSKRFIMILWAVVAIRLLVPFSIESPISFFNLIPLKTQTLTAVTEVSDAAIPDNFTDTEDVSADHAANTEQQEIILSETAVNMGNDALSANQTTADPLPDIKTVLATVWLIGALGIMVFCSVQYVMLKRKLKDAENAGGNVYVSDKISAPFVFGLFVPRIYLPDVLENNEKEYVLLHERTHIKHGDWLLKIIGVFAVAVHWFNPLVWLAYMLFEQDIEMSCDESVIGRLDAGLKQAYAMSIVSYAKQSRSKRYLVTPLGFSKVNFSKTEVTNRVKNIINFKKGKTITAIVITAVLLFIGVGFIFNSKTNAAEADGKNKPAAEPTSVETTTAETTTVETTTVETTTAETSDETTFETEIEEPCEPYEGGELWDQETDGPKMFGYYVESFVGDPYVSGGAFPCDGFDEVGFVSYCYRAYYSFALPLDVDEISNFLDDDTTSISRDDMQIGDIVIYDSGLIAIYVGDEKVVYASEAEGCICYGDLDMDSIKVIKQFISYSNDIVGVG